MRINWMESNAIPDSIITNMICRYLARLAVEKPPKVGSTEVLLVTALIFQNTLRILNTIKPVTRVFTAKDRTKLVGITTYSQILDGDNSIGVIISAIGELDIGADIGVAGYCHTHVVFEVRDFQPPTVVALADANQVA